ncbi:MAG: PhoX family phosphatase [Ideonella sp.]|nr:PhoX family phosphatase [Ideonella sp.]
MADDTRPMEDSNRSSNPDIHHVSDPARRRVLQGGAGAGLAALFGPMLAGCAGTPATGAWPAAARALIGFRGIPPGTGDTVVVPEGYVATPLAPWGEPVGVPGAMPAFRPDASNSAADQAVQMGMHHDGVHYYPLDGSRRGLLVMNHEYTDDGLLHPDGMANWSAEKVRKAQAAHGVSVIEVAADETGAWRMVRPSPHARRYTATTPFAIGGPAAGHALMRTAADPAGRRVLGTFANCAAGKTPWGTYLSGEENFADYFAAGEAPDAHQRRWGMRRGAWYRWHEHDERFDAVKHPNEANRFGWVVEIDPMDPAATPVKRTALGRAAHEGAWVGVTRSGRAVVYSGEDARFEYLYKFVSRDPIAPAGGGLTQAQANRELLDHGTLYVARFDAEGRGRWLPLVHGQGPLTPANGFADQGEVVIKARQASDALGATKMDRPEWLAINPETREVYCALTNNEQRGMPGKPGVDPAHPRANNTMGHIIRWTDDGDFDGTTMRWDHLLLAGDPTTERPETRGNIQGDAFGCPDGLMFDARGVLWIQTDVSGSKQHQGEFARLGNNQMLACDPRSGEVRRFVTGPRQCELTGATMTPDGRTLFVNIQHPGEPPGDRNDPANPGRYSRWPGGRPGDRPRSSTVVVRRTDGGPVGT